MREEGIDDPVCTAFAEALLAHVADDTDLHPLTTPRERALLGYAILLTRRPSRVTREALEALREAGLDDGEILDANQVVAYFAYVNRVADGLGVELEGRHGNDPPATGGV